MNLKIIVSISIASILLNLAGCSTNKKTSIKNEKSSEVKNEEVTKTEYLREGFVSKNTFRVVILSAGNESSEEIRQKAADRALATLRHYIISENKKYDNNVKAQLMELIDDGKLSEKKTGGREKVYFFDVTDDNLKKQVDDMCSLRR